MDPWIHGSMDLLLELLMVLLLLLLLSVPYHVRPEGREAPPRRAKGFLRLRMKRFNLPAILVGIDAQSEWREIAESHSSTMDFSCSFNGGIKGTRTRHLPLIEALKENPTSTAVEWIREK